MKRFAKVVVGHLSPATHEIIQGIGLGYDLVPCNYQHTFIDSDLAAFIADAEALYLDWCHVYHTQIENLSGKRWTEAHHHGPIHAAEWQKTKGRERQVA